MEYLNYLPRSPFHDTIVKECQAKQKWINQEKKGFLRYREPCDFLSGFSAEHIDCSQDVITIGQELEISPKDKKEIKKNLQGFMPWRKGPFSVFGIDIDAEWRSEKKWQRLLPKLPQLQGKIIADIGCNNGYYMFRMASHQPQLVVGFEPSMQHYYCFKALNGMAGFKNLHIDLLGVEHIQLFPETFDIIFLLGIIYHRSSPIEVLKDIYTALKPGGTLILESQAIPGNAPIALFPEKTYAKVPGTYFVPTGTCVKHWMQRAGLQSVDLFCTHPMSEEEQRKTKWMVFESYTDFINKEDSSLTVEGYPAPCRVFLSGRK